MSFILDALKKSENDRQRQSSPALFEVKVAAPRRKFPLWGVGVIALLGVNVLVLAWVLLRQPDAPAAPAAAVNGAAPAATNAPVAAPPGMVTVPATVTIPTTVNIPISSAPTVTMGPAPNGAPPLAVEEPLLSSHETSVPPDYNANDYVEALTPEQARAVAAARRESGVPSRDEVLAGGTQLPNLRLDLHVYAVNPVERFVFINMRKLREGESLPEGVRVEAITPTGARLSYRGRQFSLDGN